MIERAFKCNLCKDKMEYNLLIGLYYEYNGWIEKNPLDCENHICNKCLSSLHKIKLKLLNDAKDVTKEIKMGMFALDRFPNISD